MTTIAAGGAVHVGDVGTTYRAAVLDAGASFDISGATERVFVFQTPAGVLTRDAFVTLEDGAWSMSYTLVSPLDDAFHAQAGVYHWQGRLGFADGQVFHTNVQTYLVLPNLA